MEGFYIEGYAIVYNRVDRYGSTWLPSISGCKGLADYFTQPRPVLFMHGDDPIIRDWPLGIITAHRVDNRGVWIKAFLCPTKGAPPGTLLTLHQIKEGKYRAFSVTTAQGDQDFKAVRGFDELVEISVVNVPGQPLATFDLTADLEARAWIANRANGIVTTERAKRAEREASMRKMAEDTARRVALSLEVSDALDAIMADYRQTGRYWPQP